MDTLSIIHMNNGECRRWRRRSRGKERAVVGGGNGGGGWWAKGPALHCALFLFFFFEQWRMQKTKEKGKGKRSGWRWKRRRPVVSCSPLFACNVNSGECKRRRKENEKGKRKSSGWQCCSLLCFLSSSSAPLFTCFVSVLLLPRLCLMCL